MAIEPCQCEPGVCYFDKAHPGCHLRKPEAVPREVRDPFVIPACLARKPNERTAEKANPPTPPARQMYAKAEKVDLDAALADL